MGCPFNHDHMRSNDHLKETKDPNSNNTKQDLTQSKDEESQRQEQEQGCRL